ncbi:MAG: hypothetical protein ACXVB4_09370 [Pseudobdellovibrionaceae bacterium]
MKNTLVISILLFNSLQSHAIGFKNGNERTAVRIEGDISLSCQDPVQGIKFANFRCQRDILLPSEFDFFQGPEGVQADEVTLTATMEDNSTRSKKIGYDGSKNQSSKEFNLWVLSLLQRPLLGFGKNDISFVMKYKDKVTSVGSFEAFVKDGGVKICRRRGNYQSNLGNDCLFGNDRFCDQYFWENKYCLN